MIDMRKEQLDRWELYETLKGNRKVNYEALEAIKNMPAEEMKEGLLNYVFALSKRH